MSLENCSASWECGVRVKEEPGLEPEARVKQEAWEPVKQEAWEPVKQEPSEAAAALYAGHEVKGELVLGPTTLQPPDAAFATPGYRKNTEHTHSPPAERGHSPAGATRPGARRADRPRLRACSVRLERLPPAGDERAHSTILGASVESRTNDGIKPKGPPEAGAASEQSKHTGEKPYKCEICLKCFSIKGNLSRHNRYIHTHTHEKPYKCDICMKQFSRSSYLTVHKLIHSSEKPYKCEICLKCFSVKRYLSRHNRYIHTRTHEKPYKCDICMKQFSRSSYLIVHKLIHSGEKPYKCEICLKMFSHSSLFIRHNRIHTGAKPYKCAICLKQFSHAHRLNYHKRIHTGEKPYECKICLKQFSHHSNLITHNLIHT